MQAITRQADGLVYAPEATAPFSGIGQETDAEGRVLYEGEFLEGLREGKVCSAMQPGSLIARVSGKRAVCTLAQCIFTTPPRIK